MLSHFFKLAAVKARDVAEEFFKLNNIDRRSGLSQQQKSLIRNCPTSMTLHGLQSARNSSMIKKQYKRMALMLHPDKNHSVAAEEAFKVIQSAFQVLIVPQKRQSYDSSLRSKKRPPKSRHTASGSSKCSKSSGPTSEEAKSIQSEPQPTADHKARTSSCGFGSTNTKENCSWRVQSLKRQS
ncbi:hypothetical protein Patl1_21260 [Pistacia atlantica]|uniref:Uncharacterized protein n=1 Tax=Pistacia atlantica TaxID=434234 RepID=A0ACC1BKU9_9ROSI|nr:hypothetical protein Patl1_21260 [Pistacia atlantica]